MSLQHTLPSPAVAQPVDNHKGSKEPSTHKAVAGPGRFIQGMLEMPSINYKRRSPTQMAASVLIHIAVIAALVIVPGYFVTKVVEQPPKEVTLVFTPPDPAPPPPAAARAAAPKTQTTTPTPQIFKRQLLTAPTIIPKSAATTSAAQATDAPNVGIPDGVAGGSPEGVLGGIIGGTGNGPAAPATPAIVRVGGNVKRPELLKRVEPVYPTVAKMTEVQGTVLIDAVINPQGDVVKEHAVDGPAVLVRAALDAVRQWKYQPTYLNGQPVALDMEVTVTFHLNS